MAKQASKRINVFGTPYDVKSNNVSIAECINYYPELGGNGDKVKVYYKAREGTTTFLANANTNYISSVYVSTYSGAAFYLCRHATNTTKIEIRSTGLQSGSTAIHETQTTYLDGMQASWAEGPGASSSTSNIAILPVTPLNNPSKIYIVANGTYQSNVSAPIIADSIEYLAGRYILSGTGIRNFYVSDVNDPTTWPASGFAQPEYKEDSIVGNVAIQKRLWLFGPNTTEVWVPSDNPDFPFEPIQGAVWDVGMLRKNAFTKTRFGCCFLSTQTEVMYIENLNIRKISTPYIEKKIKDMFDPFTGGTIYLSSYEHRGHEFIVINRIGNSSVDGFCFVYDLNTQAWHQRKTKNITGNSYAVTQFFYSPHRDSASNAKVGGISFHTNSIVFVDETSFLDPGNRNIERSIILPHISGEDNRMFHSRFRVDMETNTHSNVVGNITLLSTDTDGKTWRSHGNQTFGRVSLSNIVGDKRVEWNRLGSSEDRGYMLNTDANIPCDITGAFLDVIKGTHT